MIPRYQSFNYVLRNPTIYEDKLIRYLLKKGNLDYGMHITLEDYSVKPMPDGGMGSLTIYPKNVSHLDRTIGPLIADICSFDEDMIEVHVSLFIDTNNVPYELDIWKCDFTPLISFSSIVDRIELE